MSVAEEQWLQLVVLLLRWTAGVIVWAELRGSKKSSLSQVDYIYIDFPILFLTTRFFSTKY